MDLKTALSNSCNKYRPPPNMNNFSGTEFFHFRGGRHFILGEMMKCELSLQNPTFSKTI